MPAATVPDVENHNGIALDGEQHPVDMRLAPMEKLTHVEREILALRRKRASFGKFGKRRYRFFQLPEPSLARFARFLRQQPFQPVGFV